MKRHNQMTSGQSDSKLQRTLHAIHIDLMAMKWMSGFALVGVMALVLKAFF